MANENVDLASLLLENPNGFLDATTAGVAQRVGLAAAQQDALAQFGKVQPEMVKPENQHLLRAEIQRVASEHPEFGGNPYGILEKVHHNFLAQAEAQKAAEADAERQQEAQSLADARRADSDAKQESDLNFAQYLMEESVRHAMTTGNFYQREDGSAYTGLEVGLRSLPRAAEPEDAEFDAAIAAHNAAAFGDDQKRALQQNADAVRDTAEAQRRAKRGERPLTNEEANQFRQGQR
jgi:hypothetical protein